MRTPSGEPGLSPTNLLVASERASTTGSMKRLPMSLITTPTIASAPSAGGSRAFRVGRRVSRKGARLALASFCGRRSNDWRPEIGRSEERAARAFKSVADILERTSTTREGDRRALLEALRKLEARNGVIPARPADRSGGDRRSDERMEEIARGIDDPESLRRESTPHSNPSKSRLDLKAALSQIVMRRQELERPRGGNDAPHGEPIPRATAPELTDGGQQELVSTSPPRDPVFDPGSNDVDQNSRGDQRSQPPASRTASLSSEPSSDDIRVLVGKLDDMRREQADRGVCAVDLSAMRGEIAAMTRSLADLAPRNAVIALEGAIADLLQRVEMMRQNGHVESLLAPLDATAAELRAAIKAHDPQTIATGLEREIRAIGDKIDGLATTAINPETFERIRRQTEEVRDLIASAASRTALSRGSNGRSANSPIASSGWARAHRRISNRPRWRPGSTRRANRSNAPRPLTP